MRLKVFELCLGLLVILGTTIPAFAQQDLLKVSLSKNVPLVFFLTRMEKREAFMSTSLSISPRKKGGRCNSFPAPGKSASSSSPTGPLTF